MQLRRRQPGQSIVLLALMMVVVVGMTGLSVDVSNAYAQQRRVQDAANAGSLAGMNAVLNKQTNAQVWNSVQQSLASNRMLTNSPDYTYKADYLLKNGTVQALAEWTGTTTNPAVISGNPPTIDILARVKVTVTKRVGTYFARVLGRNDFTVNQNGAACLGNYGIGVYPIGVPMKLQPYQYDNKGNVSGRYHRLYSNDNNAGVLTEVDPTDPVWNNGGDWNAIKNDSRNMILYLPTDNDVPGVHIAWLDWNGGNSPDEELKKEFTRPGDLQNGFVEGPVYESGPVQDNPQLSR